MADVDKLRADSHSDKLRIEIIRAINASGGAGLATEATLAAILAVVTGTNIPLASVEYTDAIAHNTTAGVNTVMITCEQGIESINGIVRPAGIYTYQPTGDDKNAVIAVNANLGRIIIDEL